MIQELLAVFVASGSAGVIVYLVGRYLDRKPLLVWTRGPNAKHLIPWHDIPSGKRGENSWISTSIVLANRGPGASKDVRISFAESPTRWKIEPPSQHQMIKTEDGSSVLVIDRIPQGMHLTLSMMIEPGIFGTRPSEWTEGFAKAIEQEDGIAKEVEFIEGLYPERWPWVTLGAISGAVIAIVLLKLLASLGG